MQFLSISLLVLMLAAVVTSVVLWVMAIYGAFTRIDLKENKWLWIAMLLFFGPIGMIAYFFVENKKRLGIISLITALIFILGIPAFAIISFAFGSLTESQSQSLPIVQDGFELNSTDLELAPSK